jgi:hypothetical protein
MLVAALLCLAGCGNSGGSARGPSDEQVKTALRIDPNFVWQSFKTESSPIAQLNGTSTKPGSLRVDVTGSIVPGEDLYAVVPTSLSMGNDFTNASSMSEKDQDIFGKAQQNEQTILSANNTIHLHNIVDPNVKLYPVPAWPANLASLIQAKSEPIAVTAHLLAEPNVDGTYACSVMQAVIPYKSMATLTPRSKMPAGTVIVGSPEWDAIAAKMQSAAAATSHPLQ